MLQNSNFSFSVSSAPSVSPVSNTLPTPWNLPPTWPISHFSGAQPQEVSVKVSPRRKRHPVSTRLILRHTRHQSSAKFSSRPKRQIAPPIEYRRIEDRFIEDRFLAGPRLARNITPPFLDDHRIATRHITYEHVHVSHYPFLDESGVAHYPKRILWNCTELANKDKSPREGLNSVISVFPEVAGRLWRSCQEYTQYMRENYPHHSRTSRHGHVASFPTRNYAQSHLVSGYMVSLAAFAQLSLRWTMATFWPTNR